MIRQDRSDYDKDRSVIRQDWVRKIRTNASLVCLEKENVLPLVRDHFSNRLAKKKNEENQLCLHLETEHLQVDWK